MPYRKVAEEALIDWRAADRRLAELDPGSDDYQQALLDAEVAKDRYQAAMDAARSAHLPEPPPFDEARAEADVTQMTPDPVDDQVFGG